MQIHPTGSPSARIMVIQDAPGYEEIRASEPLQGNPGREFNRMLHDAGLSRSECFITSIIKSQIPYNSFDLLIHHTKKDIPPTYTPFHSKYCSPILLSSLDLLIKEIDLVKPAVILALGNGPLFTLTGKWGIKSWRGSEIEFTTPSGHACIIVPCYTPAFVQQVWKERSITVLDLRRAGNIAKFGGPDQPGSIGPDSNFLVRPGFSAVMSVLRSLLSDVENAPLILSVDIETRSGHIACVGIAWTKTDAICIPYMIANGPGGTGSYWLEEEETHITHLLFRLLTHPNAQVIGQNFLYDAQYFYRWFHFTPNLVRDTMIAHHSMWSNLPKGLDYLSSMYCQKHVYWKDESKNWDPKLGEDQLWVYNCKDCVITLEVDEAIQSGINKHIADGWAELREVHDFQQSMFWPVLQTMIRGIRVETVNKAALAVELQTAITETQAIIDYMVGRPLNIRSPKQMAEFFYTELAQHPNKSRKTGNLTCDDQALQKIAAREPLLSPLLSEIGDLRSLGVFLSTFINAPLDTDERMRCSFNICGTDTYRFSSSENAFGSGLNLQNIPRGDG